MSELLLSQPLLTLFLVVALGAALGAIRFGPMRFGAAGALFVGLVLSAAMPALATDWKLVQQLGLLLFVYTVGISAGATFKSSLKQNFPLMGLSAAAVAVSAFLAAGLGKVLGLPAALTTGLFTGSLTAAPALDAATRLTGSEDAAVGYSFGYPFGVLVGIIFVTITAAANWKNTSADSQSLSAQGIHAVTVQVERSFLPRELPLWRQQKVRFSYVLRADTVRVLVPGETVEEGDQIVVVGDKTSVKEVAAQIGTVVPSHLADNRADVDFERIIVSNPDIAGRQIGQLNLPAKYGALITRVRRGDIDLLATDDFALQAGDQVAVAVPRQELGKVRSYLGDSHRQVAEVDALALGLGLVLGLLAGTVALPMPGGQVFQLGAAAGPLIVGMILGSLRRTGPLVWALPTSANLTIRQLGLLFFLAALGLGAGPAVAGMLRSEQGWKSAIVASVLVLVASLIMTLGGKIAKLSPPRVAGGLAGFLGQPAVLQAASARVSDERVESAYAALFAPAIVIKILLVPVVFLLF